jgi:hypothetical protein
LQSSKYFATQSRTDSFAPAGAEDFEIGISACGSVNMVGILSHLHASFIGEEILKARMCVMLRYSEASRTARSFGVPQDDNRHFRLFFPICVHLRLNPLFSFRPNSWPRQNIAKTLQKSRHFTADLKIVRR